MFFESPRMDDHIINVCSGVVAVWPEDSVNLSLDIGRRVAKAHHCNVERFLAAVGDHSKLVSVVWMDSPLVEEGGVIDNADIGTVLDCTYNIRL